MKRKVLIFFVLSIILRNHEAVIALRNETYEVKREPTPGIIWLDMLQNGEFRQKTGKEMRTLRVPAIQKCVLELISDGNFNDEISSAVSLKNKMEKTLDSKPSIIWPYLKEPSIKQLRVYIKSLASRGLIAGITVKDILHHYGRRYLNCPTRNGINPPPHLAWVKPYLTGKHYGRKCWVSLVSTEKGLPYEHLGLHIPINEV